MARGEVAVALQVQGRPSAYRRALFRLRPASDFLFDAVFVTVFDGTFFVAAAFLATLRPSAPLVGARLTGFALAFAAPVFAGCTVMFRASSAASSIAVKLSKAMSAPDSPMHTTGG